MSATITANNGAGSVSPIMVVGYESERESRNIIHDLIGGGIAAVLSSPRPRSGDLRLLFADGSPSLAWAALALHAEETTFTLTESDRPEVNMTYVVSGSRVQVSLDDDTRSMWVVVVPYQEVEL